MESRSADLSQDAGASAATRPLTWVLVEILRVTLNQVKFWVSRLEEDPPSVTKQEATSGAVPWEILVT
jgi:hypothetical protein